MNELPIEHAFVDVHEAIPIPPEYVIAETLPVGFTVMSGAPKKSFKSLQSLLFGAAVAEWQTNALPKWMKVLRRGPSLYISYEATAGVINYILETDCKIKTTPGWMWVAHSPFKFQLDNPTQANELLDYMTSKEPILVVIDPFRNAHSGDENDSSNVTNLLYPLVEWSHSHKSAILLVHHVNKPTEGKDGSSFYAMRGSSALPGLADGLLNIEPTKVEGEVTINATFKRGLSYRRTIHLGVPGFGWGDSGFEVYDLPTKRVQEEIRKNTLNTALNQPEVLAVTLKLQPAQVRESLETLRRNL